MDLCVKFFFFFSSRRRHTRYWRDWSSDVCSSDLAMRRLCLFLLVLAFAWPQAARAAVEIHFYSKDLGASFPHAFVRLTGTVDRSEERRVGKECRSRWSPYH